MASQFYIPNKKQINTLFSACCKWRDWQRRSSGWNEILFLTIQSKPHLSCTDVMASILFPIYQYFSQKNSLHPVTEVPWPNIPNPNSRLPFPGRKPFEFLKVYVNWHFHVCCHFPSKQNPVKFLLEMTKIMLQTFQLNLSQPSVQNSPLHILRFLTNCNWKLRNSLPGKRGLSYYINYTGKQKKIYILLTSEPLKSPSWASPSIYKTTSISDVLNNNKGNNNSHELLAFVHSCILITEPLQQPNKN